MKERKMEGEVVFKRWMPRLWALGMASMTWEGRAEFLARESSPVKTGLFEAEVEVAVRAPEARKGGGR